MFVDSSLYVDPSRCCPVLRSFSLQDFEGIFRAMDGFPVTIRMLDPPLHEFLPQEGPALKKLCEQLAKELGTDTETVTRRLEGLHECNPMMVRRDCIWAVWKQPCLAAA
jgi:pyruvate,orthophosphate dikinase